MLCRILRSLAISAAVLGVPSVASADPLGLHGNRPYIKVLINGVAAEALLDSAAEGTFIDPRLAAQINVTPDREVTARGSGGSTQVHMAKGVSIEAAGVKLTNMTVALLDMTELSKHIVGRELRIILGREFFDAARVEVDLAGGTVHKVAADVEPPGVKLLLRPHGGIESVPCKVEGAATFADIDIGNGSEVLIGKAFAEQHGLLRPERIVERKKGGGIGGSVDRDIIVLSSLELAGVKFENVRAAIDPQPTAGEVNVGTSILRRYLLTLDFAGRAAWFKAK